MRRFYLEGADGQSYDLNGSRGVYATAPTGLGFTAGYSYANLSAGFFAETSANKLPQNSVALTLNFVRPRQYSRYKEFFDWLQRAARPLCLIYDTGEDQPYRRQINVSYVTKTEIGLDGLLKCPLSVTALTPWYRAAGTALSVPSTEGSSILRYSYRYNAALRYGLDTRAAAAAEITAAGHDPASFLVRVPGPVDNPVISLRGSVSGRIYGRCSVETSIPVDSTLLLSTRYRDSFCVAEDEYGTRTDLLNAVDLSADPFFRAPVDENSVLEIIADGAVTGATAEINYYYRSV